ncbi:MULTISPECIES: DUF4335 domain-containing protein [unclassified Thermosynechococcus]|uniref:DUF4335 domain-containing protein n=1 Tax=unclassified Thermosynechococcus TaxID=2622553 RepID=UPI0019812B96|nr:MULTISPECIES: DUF4335 domain-containing protein [unclassified Thermosynechococcus]MDR5639629.1 DUF4335 domain-containing protein [Thermosynechococcus sp. PP42]MDR7921704.1 DUF4335 domain-containing protein [Thermosynechococcus sp. HY213]QSF50205.1 DUF4335 domain-containing protein [Thermosynechococcus sp. TA-1]WKT82265.1 DUF4335 domain-containing protein [Thermosynechococcus sp. PP45]WNC25882.1 DUF4335 domain-containing protein [Thermosynechococcus sp. PP551]
MLLQRQYSLPNCTLRIEGLSGQAGAEQLDIVTLCEWEIIGQNQRVKGGKEFLVALLNSVPAAAQTWLSGVKLRRSPQYPIQVEIQASNQVVLHIPRQLLQGSPTENADTPAQNGAGETLEVQLTWLQLADLVEALDQLCSDSQTLPTLIPTFHSLPRQAIAPAVPLRKQLMPLGIGAASLAVMAAIFFHLPVPERRPPREEAVPPTAEAVTPSPAPTTPATPNP